MLGSRCSNAHLLKTLTLFDGHGGVKGVHWKYNPFILYTTIVKISLSFLPSKVHVDMILVITYLVSPLLSITIKQS